MIITIGAKRVGSTGKWRCLLISLKFQFVKLCSLLQMQNMNVKSKAQNSCAAY